MQHCGGADGQVSSIHSQVPGRVQPEEQQCWRPRPDCRCWCNAVVALEDAAAEVDARADMEAELSISRAGAPVFATCATDPARGAHLREWSLREPCFSATAGRMRQFPGLRS